MFPTTVTNNTIVGRRCHECDSEENLGNPVRTKENQIVNLNCPGESIRYRLPSDSMGSYHPTKSRWIPG
ncbi:unnamed protein product [Rotaria magnacalcarata]